MQVLREYLGSLPRVLSQTSQDHSLSSSQVPQHLLGCDSGEAQISLVLAPLEPQRGLHPLCPSIPFYSGSTTISSTTFSEQHGFAGLPAFLTIDPWVPICITQTKTVVILSFFILSLFTYQALVGGRQTQKH